MTALAFLKRLLVLVLLFGTTVTAADLKVGSLTYRNVSVHSVEPDAIMLLHSEGVARIPMEKLPLSWRQRYGFDPTAAKEFRGQQKIKEAQLQKTYKTRALIENKRVLVQGNVLQTTSKGAYMRYNAIKKTSEHDSTGEPIYKKIVHNTPIFVVGLNAVQGTEWTGYLYPAGHHKYKGADGHQVELTKWALSSYDAAEML